MQESYTEIQQMYKDVSKELLVKSKKANKGSMNERWIKDYRKAIKRELTEVDKILNKNIADKIGQSANLSASVPQNFFNSIDQKYKLGLRQTFSTMFSKVPKEVISELLSGDIYKDGRGLSDRIWFANSKVNGDIDYIINKAIIEKKSAYDLAKDLQTYVNPESKKDFEWKKVYPGVGNKSIDYNAQRLARTSINHAYFMTNVRSCAKNPFVGALHWQLSAAHSARMHGRSDICDEYSNSHSYNLGTGNFPADKIPTPHPQCLCVQYAVINDSLEAIGTKLNSWLNGASDPGLDNWINKHGNTPSTTNTVVPPKPKPKKVETLNNKIQKVKDQIKANNGITTEEHLHAAGKLVFDELIKARSDLKTDMIMAQKAYDAFGFEKLQQEKKDIAKINRGFAEPQHYGYKSKEEVAKRWKQLQKEINDPRISIARDKSSETKKLYKGSQNQNISELKNKLSEIRKVGNADLDIKGHLNNSRSPMVNVVSDAYNCYPTEWAKKSIIHGNLTPKKVDRGYYSEYDKVIAISGCGNEQSVQTAIHELGHRFEKVSPEILHAEKLFYERRTKGEDLKWLGAPYAKTEKTRFDNFIEPYMGKDYQGYAYELVSMGYQYAYARPTDLWKDEDYATWIYGMLALY